MGNTVETEVKIRLSKTELVRDKLSNLGFEVSTGRVFERNTLYDRDCELHAKQEMLRLRQAGDKDIITFKGPGSPGTYKSREEIETTLGSIDTFATILGRLGYTPVFRYEKFRTEFKRAGEEHRVVTIDETPIGVFLELEGPGAWIDGTAAELGYSRADYILDSYGRLYIADCLRRGVQPSNMVFPS